MLPARDTPLLAGCAARLKRTVTACICPITPQPLVALLVCVMVLQLFAGRTAVHVLVAKIGKVLLAEATPCLNARGHRFGKRHRDVGLVALEDFIAAVVAAISNGFELIDAKDLFRLASDFCQLRSIRAIVRYLMCDDEVMFRVDCDLRIVNSRAFVATKSSSSMAYLRNLRIRDNDVA